MIVGYINGQSLEIHHSTVVEKSVDYLTADFHFMTNEWKGFRKWAHFSKGDIHYQIELKNDKVLKTDHLNLSSGEWDVYIHGSFEREIITTNKAKLVVEVTGELEGEYPEETPITPYDYILNIIGQIDKLDTETKINIVSAINEVLRKAEETNKIPEFDLSNYVTKDMMPKVNVDEVLEKIEGSVNLYQPTTEGWIDNTTIYADGSTKENVHFCLTGKIPVKPNTTYSINANSRFYCYDIDDNFIGSSMTKIERGDVYCEYGTTKDNTAYIRLNLSKETDLATTIESFNSSFMLVEGVGIEVDKYGFKAFIREIGNLSELNVEHKDNLVNAINDMFRLNTQGGVSVETSKEGNNILVFGGANE